MKDKNYFNISYIEIEGKKVQPILILDTTDNTISAYKIETKYFNKPISVKQQCYLIKDRQVAGLDSMGWINLGDVLQFPKNLVKLISIGTLSIKDQSKMLIFKKELNRYRDF